MDNISNEELERHAEELAAKLEGKVTKETVLKELNRYTREYGIGIEAAESGILKKFSAPRSSNAAVVSGEKVEKKVVDFNGLETNCTMKLKIVSCQERNIKAKDGSDKTIVSGTAGDETGTVPFTIWRSDAEIEVGKVYIFTNVYGKKFRDAPQVNIGTRGRITLVEEDMTVDTSSAPASSVSAPVVKKISELTGDEGNVDVTVQMVFVEKKTISTKDGGSKVIISGIVGDDTGTVPFTIWSDAGDFEKGAAYKFHGAYCKKFRDAPQLNLGDRGTVEPVADVHFAVPARKVTGETMRIADITESTTAASVTGKVLEVSTRMVNIRGEDRTVWGGMIADASGKIQFSAWSDPGIVQGKTYCIPNATVKSWKGIPQLNINDVSAITESEVEIEVKEASNTRTVEEVARTGGGLDVSITGIIVDVKAGSGLIKRCPNCRRALRDGSCSVCGPVENPTDDLRLKTTIDDGTGAISVIIGRNDTERISGVTLEEARAEAQNAGDSSAISNRMASKVLLKRVTVTGNVMTDEKFGPQMSARSLTEVSTDVKAEAERLYSEMEAML